MDGQLNAQTFRSDLLAGLGVAAVVAWAIGTFQVPLIVALCLGGVAFIRVFASLRRLHGDAGFPLQRFEPAPLEFESFAPAGDGDVVELGEIAASIANQPEPAPATLPTVREMQRSIERRLHAVTTQEEETVEGGSRCDEPPADDPAEELRAAITDLRRALG